MRPLSVVKGTRTVRWNRSRLAVGGLIVLVAAVWTGPQMASAAPSKPKKQNPTTTTAPPAPTTTQPPATTATTKPPATTTTTAKPAKPGGTTTTTAPPTPPTTTKPGNGGGNDGGGTGSGQGNGGGSGPDAPPGNGGLGGDLGNGLGNGPDKGSAPGAAGGDAGLSSGGSAGGSTGSSTAGTPRQGPALGRPVASVRSSGAPSLGMPPTPGGDTTVAALRGPDGAAQATVRSINGGQTIPAQGGTALYAQLASTPGPLQSDDYPGNPYLVCIILVIFGIGIGLTGHRRVEPAVVA